MWCRRGQTQCWCLWTWPNASYVFVCEESCEICHRHRHRWAGHLTATTTKMALDMLVLLFFCLPFFISSAEILQNRKVVKLMDAKEQIRKLAREKDDCNVKVFNYHNTTFYLGSKKLECPWAWDNILCWPAAPPGTIQTQRCPHYIHGFDTSENATRYCTENGTWFYNPLTNTSWTNYSGCFVNGSVPNIKVYREYKDISGIAGYADSLRMLYTVGYGVSLGSLIIALLIMCCCRRLKSKSNTLHINLFIAFILRAALSFMKEVLFVQNLGLDKNVRTGTDGLLEFNEHETFWECRTLMVLFVYSICASHMWIFMEGLYLYMLIYSTLSTERRGVKMYIISGWASPLLVVVPWIIVKSTSDIAYCWNISVKPELMWIIDGPMLAAVVVNFFFFLNILRVLISRVRATDRHMGRQQYRQLAKFILVLVPLFGVMYLLVSIIFPYSFSSQYVIPHLYFEMAYNSFQGFILALLFCFLNEEVHAEVRSMWKRKKSLRRDSIALTRSFALSSIRKSSGRYPSSTLPRNGSPVDINPHSDLRLTRMSSDSSSDNKSDDWLLRIKMRAQKLFGRPRSTLHSGSIDMQYDCDCVPDIDHESVPFNSLAAEEKVTDKEIREMDVSKG